MSQKQDGRGPMKSMHFFDDWLLYAREGLDRVQGRPKHVKQLKLEASPDPQLKMIRAGTIISYDPYCGRYVMYVECFDREDNRCMSRVESDDPYNWPQLEIAPGDGPLWTRAQNVMVDQDNKPIDCVDIMPLGGTPLADKGYVANFYDYGKTHRGGELNSDAPSAAIGFSQDGLHFDVDKKTLWIQHHSDTSNHPFYNPRTGEYVIPCRTEQSDRRVTVVTSTDLKTFSRPRIIIQPDAMDPPCREFYGMGVMPCENMFVGFLWIYDTEPTEKNWANCKMQGTNQMQLAYSYDGECWNRASREMFIPRTEPGSMMGGCVYAGPPVQTPDNRLLVLGMSCWGDHGVYMDISDELKRAFFTSHLHELRLDGFMSLRTRARHGRIQTKCILPQGGDLTVNAQTTATGYVKAVLIDADTFEPIPNYTLEDAIGVTGDELFGKLCWRERKNLDEVKDKRVLLELYLREAEIFALRFDYRVHLGEHPRDRV